MAVKTAEELLETLTEEKTCPQCSTVVAVGGKAYHITTADVPLVEGYFDKQECVAEYLKVKVNEAP